MANESENLIQPFGYTEMYEWAEKPLLKYGRFVTFDSEEPDKIALYHTAGSPLLGVSSITSAAISDDPEEWVGAYGSNEVGDLYMGVERLAVGVKQYDVNKEFSYICTKPWEHYVKIPNPNYREGVPYRKRTNRDEWVRVNLIGKVIVYDNGTCTPGEYCTPYVGPDKALWGTAIKWTASMKKAPKFYVISRYSDAEGKQTILMLNKNMA